jgi:hypothetical protein
MSPDSCQLKPIATWNGVRGAWETGKGSLFCEHAGLFWQTWPALGSMRNGAAYERPTSVPRTGGNEFSSSPGSLMGTPTSRDYKGIPGKNVQMASLPRDVSLLPTPRAWEEGGSPQAWDERQEQVMENGHCKSGIPLSVAVTLLPIPNASDGDAGKISRSGDRKGERLLGGIVKDLLPTPNTLDNLPPKTREQIKAHRDEGRGGDRNLREAVLYELENEPETVSRWGKYEPAIRRWESILGRSAPSPTEPTGKDSAHRLSPVFTEWMMGFPEGWVTGSGVSRKAQLHILGNSCVPAQAAAALRILLQRMDAHE